MSLEIIITIFGVVITTLLLVLIFRKQNKSEDDDVIRKEIEILRNAVEGKLERSAFDIQNVLRQQSTDSHKIFGDVKRELGTLQEASKQVLSTTEQLQNLEKVLTNQKQRGNWGEGSLEFILSNTLQASFFEMQYHFPSGGIVDAVIKIKNDKLLPIDSKFPLENYRRAVDADNDSDKKYFAEQFQNDVKVRIEETAKYIRENEGTLPLAFMFIPSEAVYYDLNAGEQSRLTVNTEKLIEQAHKKHIFIVSPTSILPYVYLVLAGIKAFNIEENTKEIQKQVEQLGRHIGVYDAYLKKIGNTLGFTVSHYNNAYKEFGKVSKDVKRITGGIGPDIEPLVLDKPIHDEE